MRLEKKINGAELIRKDNGYNLYKIVFNESSYYVYVVSKRFSKYQNIILKKDGTVVVEYMYLFGGRCGPTRVEKVLCKAIPDKSHFTFMVIRGTPSLIRGLDDGVHSSYRLPLESRLIYFLSFKELLSHFEDNNE